MLTADSNYALPMAVTIESIMRNLSTDQKIRFHLLTTPFGEIKKERFLALMKKWDGRAEFCWTTRTEDVISDLPTLDYLSRAMYFRLWAGEIIPSDVKKIIYLDCDVLVLGDLSELFEKKLSAPLLAVQDLVLTTIAKSGISSTSKSSQVDSNLPFFNSGVLVVDLDYWRSERVGPRSFEYLRETKCMGSDQEALNFVYAGKWSELEYHWNWMHSGFSINELEDSMKRKIEQFVACGGAPKLLHFFTKRKPWSLQYFHPEVFRYMSVFLNSGWVMDEERDLFRMLLD